MNRRNFFSFLGLGLIARQLPISAPAPLVPYQEMDLDVMHKRIIVMKLQLSSLYGKLDPIAWERMP